MRKLTLVGKLAIGALLVGLLFLAKYLIVGPSQPDTKKEQTSVSSDSLRKNDSVQTNTVAVSNSTVGVVNTVTATAAVNSKTVAGTKPVSTSTEAPKKAKSSVKKEDAPKKQEKKPEGRENLDVNFN